MICKKLTWDMNYTIALNKLVEFNEQRTVFTLWTKIISVVV